MKPKKIKSSDFAGLVRPAPEQTNAPRRASANPSGYGHEGNYGGGSETDNPSYGNGNPSYGSGNPSYGGDSYYGGGYKVYTVEEFYNWEGVWPGGYVEGMGYVMGDVVIDGEYTGDKPYYNYSYWPYPYLPEWAPYYWLYYNKEYNDYPYYNHQYDYPEPPEPEFPGGGGEPSDPPTTPASLTDGINVDSGNYAFINETFHKEFYEQLKRILKSNSELKDILKFFEEEEHSLVFRVEPLNNKYAEAKTRTYSQYCMDFGIDFIPENGTWNGPIRKSDEIGFNWERIKTKEEAFIVTLSHESLHLNHYTILNDAVHRVEEELGKKDFNAVYQRLKDGGHSQDFIEIFLEKKDGNWIPRNDDVEIGKRDHKYIKEHELPKINKILDEYEKDFGIKNE